MFVVTYQDLRHWAPFDKLRPKPKPVTETFETKDLADARKSELQTTGIIACVTPLTVKRGATPKQVALTGDGEPFNANWKMTR